MSTNCIKQEDFCYVVVVRIVDIAKFNHCIDHRRRHHGVSFIGRCASFASFAEKKGKLASHGTELNPIGKHLVMLSTASRCIIDLHDMSLFAYSALLPVSS